jgi:hypothetical protein
VIIRFVEIVGIIYHHCVNVLFLTKEKQFRCGLIPVLKKYGLPDDNLYLEFDIM